MAAPTTNATKPKRKPQGPRNAKPKVFYLVYKGQIEGEVKVMDQTGPEFVDMFLNDRDLKYTKITIEPKSRKPAAPVVPTE